MTIPAWFQGAVDAVPETGAVVVDGCTLRTLRWGTRGAPGLVFIHGGAAHADWWRFIAPFFSRDFDVLAFDLSGHGDSGRREHYLLETWAGEVNAVIEHAGFSGKPFIVGHSLGGLISITTAALYGERLAGAMVIDSVPRDTSNTPERAPVARVHKTYPTFEAALARFRLLPSQPSEHPFVLDFIARTSLKRVGDGWSWKFDPSIFDTITLSNIREYLGQAKCRMAVMRGELSKVLTPELGQLMFEWLGRKSPVIEIPQAHHHVMLDQPIAFVSAVRMKLADWQLA